MTSLPGLLTAYVILQAQGILQSRAQQVAKLLTKPEEQLLREKLETLFPPTPEESADTAAHTQEDQPHNKTFTLCIQHDCL